MGLSVSETWGLISDLNLLCVGSKSGLLPLEAAIQPSDAVFQAPGAAIQAPGAAIYSTFGCSYSGSGCSYLFNLRMQFGGSEVRDSAQHPTKN
jgi:hypothetical protein